MNACTTIRQNDHQTKFETADAYTCKLCCRLAKPAIWNLTQEATVQTEGTLEFDSEELQFILYPLKLKSLSRQISTTTTQCMVEKKSGKLAREETPLNPRYCQSARNFPNQQSRKKANGAEHAIVVSLPPPLSTLSPVPFVQFEFLRSPSLPESYITHSLTSPRPQRLLRLLRTERVAVCVREDTRRRGRAVRVASDGRAGEAAVAVWVAAKRADVVSACRKY